MLDAQHWAQLEQVQRQVNRAVAFTSDEAVWGHGEYWEPAVDRGDCEDIALAKRARLMDLGWPAEALRIAVATDEHGRLHALLTVDATGRDGRSATWALDNRLTYVEPWQRLTALGYRWLERQKPGSAEWVSLAGPPGR
jgi:predicted transglutaminase-like cysteine proteinase